MQVLGTPGRARYFLTLCGCGCGRGCGWVGGRVGVLRCLIKELAEAYFMCVLNQELKETQDVLSPMLA